MDNNNEIELHFLKWGIEKLTGSEIKYTNHKAEDYEHHQYESTDQDFEFSFMVRENILYIPDVHIDKVEMSPYDIFYNDLVCFASGIGIDDLLVVKEIRKPETEITKQTAKRCKRLIGKFACIS